MELTGSAGSRFSVEDRRETLKNIKMVAMLGAFLVPLFAIVDYFAYPQHFVLFAAFRLMCTLCMLAVWKISQLPVGKRNFRAVTVILPVIPAFFTALMIGVSQDPGSPYFAGLTLSLVAIGFVFHWTYREAFFGSVLVLLMYSLACLPAILDGASMEAILTFVCNSIFIFAVGLVITAGSFAHHRIRINGFLARNALRHSQHNLSVRNEDLRRILQELSETERQLIHSEKMSSLGQLSAGVIHEIGNPLNFSNQALYLLKKKIHSSDLEQIPEIIRDMQEGHDRISEIVSELREFSHKGAAGKKDVFCIEEAVHSAIRMLGKPIESNRVKISLNLIQTPDVLGVKNQITQVIMNLVQNAIHAVEQTHHGDTGHIEIDIESRNNQVLAHVTDNGPGLSDEARAKLFDPFFTTKKPGQGTGLGLSICYRILEAHHGNLTVESSPGTFTRFTISLPKYNDETITDSQRKIAC
ncbi:MAG: HAMP domain-containing sensor histidine kinase [Verrucomicrobiales bacterium]|nr:HAMP domain-containing sensor histidine kinase [Verrucomicrobiales bacterium]